MGMWSHGEATTAPSARARSRISLTGRLLIPAAIAVMVALAVIAGLSGWNDEGREAVGEVAKLTAAAALAADLSAEATAAGDHARAARALQAIHDMPGLTYARIELADGRTLAETGKAGGLKRDLQAAANRAGPFQPLTDRSIETSAPIQLGPRRVGEIVLSARTDSPLDRFLANMRADLAAALAAIAAGAFAAWRLRKGLARPEEAPAPPAVAEPARQAAAPATPEAEPESDILARLPLRKEPDREEAPAAPADSGRRFRAPLDGMVAMAELLAAGELSPRQRRFAEAIAGTGASLRAAASPPQDSKALEAVAVDIAELAEEVVRLFWAAATDKGLDLAAYVDPATPRRVATDPTRLRQILILLVDAALATTRAGGVLIEVEPDASGALRFSVRDTGPGFAKPDLAVLLDERSDADLAVSKRLVETMGGRFQVASEAGRGTAVVFRLLLPVVDPAAAWAAAPRPGAAARLACEGVSTRRALGRYLARAGYSLDSDGSRPDLVVAAASALHGGKAQIPTICLADYGASPPHERLATGAAHALLARPVRRAELQSLLKQAQKGGPLRDEHRVQDAYPAEAPPSFAGARVLVADADPIVRETARNTLARLSVQVVLAASGPEAVEAVEDGSFDLVLLGDLQAPMTREDAARVIRAFETEHGVRRTPVAAMMRSFAGAAAEAWRAAGMDALLHRPFTLPDLAALLGGFIEPTAAPAVVIASSAPPPAVAIAIDPRLIDAQAASSLAAMAAGGKAEQVAKVQAAYRDNAPTAAADLLAALENGEAEAAAKAAHGLTSMSLNIGAKEVARLTAMIEQACRDGHAPGREAGIEVQSVLKSTLEALARPFATPPAPPPGPTGAPRITTVAARIPPEVRTLLDDLDEAIATDQLAMVYQPQMDRDGQNITGVEALVRWTHPTRGFVSPADFIPVAEAWGQIAKVTDWVMHRATVETLDIEGLPVGFNASALEFADDRIVARIEKTLARTGFDPRRLEVEITETAILENEDQVRENMNALRAMGMKVVLDDFGAGHSSLSHLRRYAFDKLKIDREFVIDCTGDVQSATVVHAVVSIGRALGMKVVAEGVETEQQRQFLRIAGVHAMQGYLFGRPMPIAALKETLALARTMRARA